MSALATCAPSDDLANVEWAAWLNLVVPSMATAGFADHHAEFWEWVWAIEPGIRPETFVGVWARGGAKSSSAEGACVALGARRRRSYALYVCGTQEQADDHVGNVAALLEASECEFWYPDMADRFLGKHGNSKGWRRNRIRTAAGFTVDALGLDTAARGVKLENQRPDLLIIDDIDAHDDSPRIVAKKIDALTKKLLPAGSPDLAVLAIQNLVHRDGVFARLVDGRAKFLARRIVSGPVPAVRGLATRHEAGRDVITQGEPTWVGQTLTTCQEQIDAWGLPAFLSEAQHEVDAREGALWVREQLATCRRDTAAAVDLVEVVVAVDPSGGSGPDNDAQGIVVLGKDVRGHGWVLDDVTCTESPRGWGDAAVDAFVEWDADGFVAEVNYGGDMVVEVLTGAIERKVGKVLGSSVRSTSNGKTITLTVAGRAPIKIHVVTASRGKAVRAQPVAALFGRPDEPETWSTASVSLAGVFDELEEEMLSWRAEANWSPNRMDAMVWGLTHLMVDVRRRGARIVGGGPG